MARALRLRFCWVVGEESGYVGLTAIQQDAANNVAGT